MTLYTWTDATVTYSIGSHALPVASIKAQDSAPLAMAPYLPPRGECIVTLDSPLAPADLSALLDAFGYDDTVPRQYDATSTMADGSVIVQRVIVEDGPFDIGSGRAWMRLTPVAGARREDGTW